MAFLGTQGSIYWDALKDIKLLYKTLFNFVKQLKILEQTIIGDTLGYRWAILFWNQWKELVFTAYSLFIKHAIKYTLTTDSQTMNNVLL